MNAYERLIAEELPTGTFGHALPPDPPPRPIRPWTPEEQAQHYAVLARELATWVYREPDPEEPPHLRLVDDTADIESERHSA